MSTSIQRGIVMLDMLRKDHYTALSLANKLKCSDRTIYRYLLMFEEMGYPIEKDFQNRYFIVTLELV